MTLRIERVTAGYFPGRPVVRDVSLEVDQCEILTVLGSSGSGKTTLLRVIAGLHKPDSGGIHLDNRDVTAIKPEKRRIALVPQEGALFPHIDVASNIGYGLQGRGYGALTSKGEREARVTELLELIDMAGYGTRLPHQLSGGQQQRVSLARALAPNPAAVLLDEPFSSLDAGLRLDVRSEVVELLREAEVPAILITHDQDEAMSVSDTIAILNDGAIEQVGTPREVYQQPKNQVVAKATGDCVIVSGESLGLGSEYREVVVRPEQFELIPEVQGDGGPAGSIPGIVGSVTYRGKEQLVNIALDSGVSITANVAAQIDWSIDDRVLVRINGAPHAI